MPRAPPRIPPRSDERCSLPQKKILSNLTANVWSGIFAAARRSRPGTRYAGEKFLTADESHSRNAPNRCPIQLFRIYDHAEKENRGRALNPGGDGCRPCFCPGAPVVRSATVGSTGGAHRALSGPAAGADSGRGDLPQRYSRRRPVGGSASLPDRAGAGQRHHARTSCPGIPACKRCCRFRPCWT